MLLFNVILTVLVSNYDMMLIFITLTKMGGMLYRLVQ